MEALIAANALNSVGPIIKAALLSKALYPVGKQLAEGAVQFGYKKIMAYTKGRKRKRATGARTVTAIKKKARYKRKSTKALGKWSRKRSRQKSRLRGLVGPQCLPKTASCTITYKVCGQWNPDLSAAKTNVFAFYQAALVGSAGVRPTPWISTTPVGPLQETRATSSRILDFLGDMFDRYRVIWIKHNFKWTRIQSELGLAGGQVNPLIVSVGPVDYDEKSGTNVLVAPDNPQDIMLDPAQDTKVFPRNWEDASASIPSGTLPISKRFKCFKKIPKLLGIPPKEYWTEDEYSGSIQGDIGARVWGKPPKHAVMAMILANLDQTNLPSVDAEFHYFVGTVQLRVYFDAWNQVYRVKDV